MNDKLSGDITDEIFQKLVIHFNSIEKAIMWMTTENPHLGNVTPEYMILINRGHKVLQFIDLAIEENKRNEHD